MCKGIEEYIDFSKLSHPFWKRPTKTLISENIEATKKAIHGQIEASDINYLLDVVTLLEEIKKNLPEEIT